MRPSISVITLGVDDLERSLAFYRDGLGLPTRGIFGTEYEHGAVAFFLARDVIGTLTTGWMLWFGLFFVVLVLFKPEGIAGMFASWRARQRLSTVVPARGAQLQAGE